MTRLPNPGGDQNKWGDILNSYLLVSHTEDGTIKPNAVTQSHIRNNSITTSKLSTDLQQQIADATSGGTGTGQDGADGVDGREIELSASSTHLQWRYVGDSTWINLVSLADITGPQGEKGDTGDTGPQGPAGQDGVDGGSSGSGVDGREVELRTGTTHIQWRYVGDTTWINLVALSDITGPQGLQGPQGEKGDPGATTVSGIDGLQSELDGKVAKSDVAGNSIGWVRGIWVNNPEDLPPGTPVDTLVIVRN